MSCSGVSLPRLDALDSELHIMAESFLHVQSTMSQHLANRRRQRNLLLPLFRLPDELLARIIGFSVQSPKENPHEYLRKLQHIAQVSTKFASLTLNSPSLWGLADSRSLPSMLTLALRKSKSAPLDVVYTLGRGSDWRGGSRGDFLAIVAAESGRWRSLEIRGLGLEMLKKALEQHTPRLRDLTLNHSAFFGTIEIPANKLAQLDHLTLSGRMISWNVNVLSRLRSLELRDLNEGIPSIAELLSVIQKSPNLSQLHLQRLKFTDAPQEPSPPVQLAQLCSVSLLEIAPTKAHTIMNSIRFPSCTSLRLSGALKSEPDILDVQTVPLLTATIHSILSHCHTLCINVQAKWIEYNGEAIPPDTPFPPQNPRARTRGHEPWTSSTRLYLNLPVSKDPLPSSHFQILNVAEVVSPPLRVRLILSTAMTPAALVRASLKDAPAVTALVFAPRAASSGSEWMACLGKPLPDGTWPLPRLNELVMCGMSTTPGGFLDMIRRRYGKTGGADAKNPVASLETLRFVGQSGLNDIQFKELSEILQDTNILKDGRPRRSHIWPQTLGLATPGTEMAMEPGTWANLHVPAWSLEEEMSTGSESDYLEIDPPDGFPL